MDLNKLKIFYILAQVKSYSKCAEKLFITQSAVSHAIKSLEQSLDMQLVEKKRGYIENRPIDWAKNHDDLNPKTDIKSKNKLSPKSGILSSKKRAAFALTEQGKILFRSCQTIFSEIEKTKQSLAKSNGGMEFIRLGSTVEFGMSVILKSIKNFFDRHPNIHIDFRLSHNLLQPLLDNELDMIIDCRPHAHPEIKSIHLFREEYSVIATPEYIQLKRIETPEDLQRCNILSMDSELVWWSNFINSIPASKQNIFNKITEINHVRGIIIATLCSMGVGFVPKYTIFRELQQGTLVELFPELDILNDNINIFIRHRNLSEEKFLCLIDFLRTLILF